MPSDSDLEKTKAEEPEVDDSEVSEEETQVEETENGSPARKKQKTDDTTTKPSTATGTASPSIESTTSDSDEDEESPEIRKLRREFPSVLGPGIGTCSERLSLKLSDTEPVFVEATPLPFALREPVAAELRRLESQGVIRKVEDSKYGTPIVPDFTYSDKLLIYADYQTTIAPKLIRGSRPVMNINKFLYSLKGSTLYSILTYRTDGSIHQFLLDESSQPCTAINTHIGTFVYQRAPCNLSGVSDQITDFLKKKLKNAKNVSVFLDSIIVKEDSSKKKHLAKLRTVLSHLRVAGLRFDLNAKDFMQKNIYLLGNKISKHGFRADPDRLRTVKEMEYPFEKAEKKLLIQLLEHYYKYIPGWKRKKSQMRVLLEENTGISILESHFKTLRNTLIHSDVLMNFNSKYPLVLATHADMQSLKVGCVLSHRLPGGGERPISFSSFQLNKAQSLYSQLETKALATWFGVNTHSSYIRLSNELIIKTNHKPLKDLLERKMKSPMAVSRAHSYATRLKAYNFEVELVRVNEATALARLSPLCDEFGLVERETYVDYVLKLFPIGEVKFITDSTKADPILNIVHDYVMYGPRPKDFDPESRISLKHLLNIDTHYLNIIDSLTIDKGCVLYEGRLVVPEKLKDNVLKKLHNFQRDNSDTDTMKDVARKFVYWPSLDKDIEAFDQNIAR